MKTFLLLCWFICISTMNMFSQKWVDTLYDIQLTKDIAYGSSIDFAGTLRNSMMNICVPTNDTIPTCGRPLLLAIHGGAFLAGNKDADQIPGWVSDFAKRGYVSASINYRLGMFQTNNFINCNISAFGAPWNCLNMQDTAEWYRAAYRAMQDAKGAIRYLVNHAAVYHIDPKQLFVVGESAGGFIALSTAFLDDASEKPVFADSLPNALPPNSLYENQCIQTPGFASNIAAMNTTRPDLGSIDGDMNPSSIPYSIKGVGSFYGAMMHNLFTTHSYTKAPVLYLYHQPNDLVVPYNEGVVEGGVSYCATQFPFNCQYLINLPYTYGSKAITTMIDGMSGGSIPIPTYLFDTTANTADCFAQLANPTLAGHRVDNPALRSLHLAQFFASEIDTIAPCFPLAVANINTATIVTIIPNPANDYFSIVGIREPAEVLCTNMSGHILLKKQGVLAAEKIAIAHLPKGVYAVAIKTALKTYWIRMLK